DRKSTRLNSSHVKISYAVFCLKKKKEPDKFKPERFKKKGEDQKLMPSGLGRRACPGSGLAQRVVYLALGSMIQCFDWKRIGEDFVDISEATTMRPATPLLAMCKARPLVHNIQNSAVHLDLPSFPTRRPSD